MNLLSFRSVLALSALGAALSAQAVVLDFESLSGGTAYTGFAQFASPLLTQGFRLNETMNGFVSINPTVGGMGQGGGLYHTGSRTISAYDQAPFTIAPAGGGSFSLASLDAAPGFLDGTPGISTPGTTTILFTGILAAGGALSRVVVLPSSVVVTHLAFSGWTGLTSLVIDDSLNPYQFAQIDNVDVTPSPVPEPSALAALGLGALALLKRRKRA